MRNKMIWCGALCVLFLSASAAQAAAPASADPLAGLKAKDEAARVKAIDQLAEKGAKAADAVPALTALLKDKSATVRAHAANALGHFGAAAKPAVKELAALVDDPEVVVRIQAVQAIAAIRPGPKVAVPMFEKLVQGNDTPVRNRVLQILTEGGKDSVPFLVEALKNKKTAYWACLVINQIGPDAKDTVPGLAALLADKDPLTRREAAMALAEIGPAAAAAIPQLTKALDDKMDCVSATYALGIIGKANAEAEAKIRKNLESPDEVLSVGSIWTLARLHPEDKKLVREATEKLVVGLKAKDELARLAAARALAALKPGPEISIAVLDKALQGADEEVIRDALRALAAGLGPDAVPKLVEALKHEKARFYVVCMLGDKGPDAKAAVGELVKLLDDKNPDVQNEVPMALAKIGPAAKDAVPALVKALAEKEGHVRYGVAYALGRIGPQAIEAAPALVQMLDGQDESLLLISAWALTNIEPKNAKTAAKSVPILTRGLGDKTAVFRQGSAEGLKNLGALGKPAAAALKKALKDEDKGVREMAAEALKAVGG
jgi:HEAT repeat protein